MASCMLNHEGIKKKWWPEAVNTAGESSIGSPYLATVTTPYEIFIIIRSRVCHTDDATDSEEAGARKKMVVASYKVGTKLQKLTQESPNVHDQLLTIYDGGQAM
ncbi:hypothetical protein F441_09032 [Phytophthora nicotianae CJ01A1]|uniref:Uncharacterized protein n=1 Tax=Phytophthora nicotianae CJ01A1 TaxID=1317063 RepID=W2X364_PHYNI|nr:hypothetical protein F441_09032 [Phytophthora nicotianae CJ01A1]